MNFYFKFQFVCLEYEHWIIQNNGNFVNIFWYSYQVIWRWEASICTIKNKYNVDHVFVIIGIKKILLVVIFYNNNFLIYYYFLWLVSKTFMVMEVLSSLLLLFSSLCLVGWSKINVIRSGSLVTKEIGMRLEILFLESQDFFKETIVKK